MSRRSGFVVQVHCWAFFLALAHLTEKGENPILM